MGGGKRKPELESQTKRVTQKQKQRDTKLKKKQQPQKNYSDMEPRVWATGLSQLPLL